MSNDREARLAFYGIDYATAIDRFAGNEDLFARLAVKYRHDPHVDTLEAALDTGDVAAGEREAHSLKGIAGNLSFTKLYDLSSRVTDLLREGNLADARALMPELRASHNDVVSALDYLRD